MNTENIPKWPAALSQEKRASIAVPVPPTHGVRDFLQGGIRGGAVFAQLRGETPLVLSRTLLRSPPGFPS